MQTMWPNGITKKKQKQNVQKWSRRRRWSIAIGNAFLLFCGFLSQKPPEIRTGDVWTISSWNGIVVGDIWNSVLVEPCQISTCASCKIAIGRNCENDRRRKKLRIAYTSHNNVKSITHLGWRHGNSLLMVQWWKREKKTKNNVCALRRRHLPVWWAIGIWIDHDERCMQHFRCDHRSPLWHRRCPNRAAHFSASTSMPNCREPIRRYLVAFSWPAMNSRWFLLLMHNLFANCYLPWNFQTKSTTNKF